MKAIPAFLIVLICSGPLWAGPVREAKLEFFESRIRPVLVKHCYECHSAESGNSKGGLRLDSRQGWRTGGDSGPAIIPGRPDESHVILAINRSGEMTEMPPTSQLARQVVDDFRKWIADGAVDPRKGNALVHQRETIDIDAGRRFWSFQPVRSFSDEDSIDGFIHPKAPRAAADQLVRRLFLDLIGLPPTEDERQEFLHRYRAQSPDDAVKTTTDQLLGRKDFGEKWARHWLDVVRYADSNGGDFNLTYQEAWRYRNFVIDAFNQDLPYDQFVREQIAGDLLPFDNLEQRNRQLIATGFLMVAAKMLTERDKVKMHLDIADEQLDTIGRAMMGLTLGCARCHDHKFDPIPTADYYAMAGILHSTRTADRVLMNNVNVTGWTETELLLDQQTQSLIAKHQSRLEALQQKIEQQEAALESAQSSAAELEALKSKFKELQDNRPKVPKAMAAMDNTRERFGDLHIRIRGEPGNLGPKVPRGFLRVACEAGSARTTIPAEQSGRLQLAQWLTQPNHPLTARVMVNRIWQQLFGQGIVATSDNFGTRGARPSHPELLDYLAAKFVADGWSIKSLIREIVCSRTYQQSVLAASEDDPGNVKLQRQNRRPLPAETIRDSMLMLARQLDRQPRDSVVEQLGMYAIATSGDRHASLGQTGELRQRSIYLPIVRGAVPPSLAVFDFPNPDLVTGKRASTTVPAQALFMMNSPFVREMAKAVSIHVAKQDLTTDAIVQQLYQQILIRDADAEDLRMGNTYITREMTAGKSKQEAVASLVQVLFSSTEFRFIE